MFRVSMRYARLAAAPLVLLSALALAADEPADKPAIKLESTKDKASYGIGYNIGSSIRREGLDLDAQTIAAGIAAALKGEKSAISPEDVQAAIEEMAKAKSAAKLTANQKFPSAAGSRAVTACQRYSSVANALFSGMDGIALVNIISFSSLIGLVSSTV